MSLAAQAERDGMPLAAQPEEQDLPFASADNLHANVMEIQSPFTCLSPAVDAAGEARVLERAAPSPQSQIQDERSAGEASEVSGVSSPPPAGSNCPPLVCFGVSSAV